uniref:Uncharacterized protein n=1 Tax=Rhizophora mucronata TaxID=61149 RepID=A0A2P2LS14_RHIMU
MVGTKAMVLPFDRIALDQFLIRSFTVIISGSLATSIFFSSLLLQKEPNNGNEMK